MRTAPRFQLLPAFSLHFAISFSHFWHKLSALHIFFLYASLIPRSQHPSVSLPLLSSFAAKIFLDDFPFPISIISYQFTPYHFWHFLLLPSLRWLWQCFWTTLWRLQFACLKKNEKGSWLKASRERPSTPPLIPFLSVLPAILLIMQTFPAAFRICSRWFFSIRISLPLLNLAGMPASMPSTKHHVMISSWPQMLQVSTSPIFFFV